MPDTYTPPTGNTIPAAQLQALQAALPGFSMPADAGQALKGYVDTSKQASDLTAQMPQFQQQSQQAASQQANIPQADQTYGNLADMYKLFLLDHNLSKQYTRPDMQQPGTPTNQPSDVATFGSVGTPQMPVLTQQSLQQGFQGFTDPSLASTAASQQGQGILGALKNLSDYISNQSGWATTQSTAASQTQQAKISALMQLAGVYGNIWSTQQSAANQNSNDPTQQALGQLQQDINNGATFSDLAVRYGNYVPLYQLRAMYNKRNYYGKPAKESDFEINQYISGAKKPPTVAQQQKLQDTQTSKISALKGFGSMLDAFYGNTTSLGPVDITAGLGSGNYLSQKDIYIRQLQSSLKASKSNATAETFAKNLPDMVSTGSEGKFKGHLTQVLNSSGMQLYVNKKTKNIGVADYKDFDPNTETKINVNDLSMDQIRSFLSSL